MFVVSLTAENLMIMRKIRNYIVVLAAIMLVACGGNEFKVSGNIEGASDTTKLVIEVSNNGMWLIADSVKPSANGSFSVALPAPKYADIYRLRYNDKSIYFPIDSLDKVEIKSDLKSFSTEYTLGGSANAELLMNIDKKAMQMYGANAEALKEWKKELANTILGAPSSIVAYYIINKYIGETPLYDPFDKEDLKMIGAVANAYNTYKPNDPRTAYLVNMAIRSRRMHTPVVSGDTLVVDEIPLLNITLQDEKGQMQNLDEIAAQGKVILLNFTIQSDELSPAFNNALVEIYNKYKSKGFEIYQISYDTDEFQWRQTAKNLPWISVYDGRGIYSPDIAKYNIIGFPTTFIINRKGELAERVVDVTTLSQVVAKYL